MQQIFLGFRKNIYVNIFMFGIVLLGTLNTLQAQDTEDIIVRYKEGMTPTLSKIDPSNEVIAVRSIFEDLNLYVFTLRSDKKKAAIINNLQGSPNVLYAHPSMVLRNRQVPNDPDYPAQWSLPKIGMEEVWDITTGGLNHIGKDIVIAVLDDGYQMDHPELNNVIWSNDEEIADNGIDDDNNGYVDDFFGLNARTLNDDHEVFSHGTSVLGIIGATSNDERTMAGINWNAKMMLLSSGRQDEYRIPDLVASYNYIYKQRKLYNETNGVQGAYVVATNYSGGVDNAFPSDFPELCEIYEMLGSVGIINVGAAPNNGDTDIDVEGDLPGTCPSNFLIITTNTDQLDRKVQGAGQGTTGVDLGAPGDEIFTIKINSATDPSFFGTSASAPHIAGVISLMYHLTCEETYNESISNPSSVALRIKNLLLENVSPSPDLMDKTATGGRLDALAAILAVEETIGDCCEISIDELIVQDVSCLGATDGSVEINASAQDLEGQLTFQVTDMNGTIESNLTVFGNLPTETYGLAVADDLDATCRADTTFMIGGNPEACPFGNFEISAIRSVQNDQMVFIDYDLDEQKDIQVQIVNAAGQVLESTLITPSLNDGRTYEVNTSNYPSGIYYASIIANDQIDTKSFRIIR